ncbi:TetR/AcrR family transcriptional regulator [Sulfitobacter aestuariivivens]|uniref:TetR/AcrR family transcriptional regulator n=1 Tax=Sulfitobacter aestuariivivens TaxID=2766981 RepID=A0A927HDQ4_9RHOB|nr:TetR/AcrR family transcriptional regulator [Sulfitobacter aestuariivivens]MBD3662588.1 TetR/AcrR family transcriptional regulator [Sulfitobacter aestuariivivens]
MQDKDTKAQILSVARQILAKDGLDAVSFDAIARRIGYSKQAVLYWYPNKHALLNAMFVPWLSAEADAAEAAVSNATNSDEAIASFVSGMAMFHFDDLNRFRMMYLLPQTISAKLKHRSKITPDDSIHQITNRLYGALASRLSGDQRGARKKAVAIHSAVLGVILMFALADAVGDPLKHSETDLVDALIGSLTAEQNQTRHGDTYTKGDVI